LVQLPKFELSHQVDVMAILKKSAASIAGTPDADFTGIAADLYIGDAQQAAILKVDEDGFDAAAVTAIRMLATGMPPRDEETHELKFDRPFALAVVDPKTNLPLFTAWIANPSA